MLDKPGLDARHRINCAEPQLDRLITYLAALQHIATDATDADEEGRQLLYLLLNQAEMHAHALKRVLFPQDQ